jgi:uncharacterized protein YqjF (DUF2071 family)
MRFLTAEWRDLIHLQYEAPRSLLLPLVPKGTELDRFEGRLLASLVGFRFVGMGIRGIPIPGYGEFEEVNLRFYVVPSGHPDKRAVVFIRELVPTRVVAEAARLTYNEPYLRVPMSHAIGPEGISYRWTYEAKDFEMRAAKDGAPRPLAPGSVEEFIGDRHWGYTRMEDGSTIEYQVDHPRWEVVAVKDVLVSGPLATLYGDAWAEILSDPPCSAFYAVGSKIAVHAWTPFAA